MQQELFANEPPACVQDKIAENEARAADMQAHMDALQLSTAALQSRNDELVSCFTQSPTVCEHY